MSLINQMLRDLEQRNSDQPKATVAQPLQIEQVVYPHKLQNNSLSWWLVVLLASMVIILALIGFGNTQPETLPPSTVKEQAQNLTISPAVTEQALPIKQNTEPKNSPDHIANPDSETVAVTEPIQPMNPSVLKPAPKATPNAAASKTKKITSTDKSHLPVTKVQSSALKQNTDQTEEALYRQAESSVSRSMRKAILLELLASNPNHLAARNMMLQTLQQEKSGIELKQFLDDSLALFPGNPGFTTALAHWHIKQKNADAAINTLETLDYRQNHDPQYLALKAAGYQQQQNFSQALPLYQELTHLQPDKAEHWLGLGICADRLQQSDRAMQAYQQALNKKTLHSDVVHYIKQRLLALAS